MTQRETIILEVLEETLTMLTKGHASRTHFVQMLGKIRNAIRQVKENKNCDHGFHRIPCNCRVAIPSVDVKAEGK